MLLMDGFFITLSYFLAYFIRFEESLPYHEWINFRNTILYILIIKLLIFVFFDLYRGMWRYTSLVDLLNIFKANTVSSGLIILSILFIYRFEGFPRSVFVIDGILCFLFISSIRVGIRIILSEQENGLPSLDQIFHLLFGKKLLNGKKRLLIIGAGDAGEKMLREIRDNPRLNYEVAGFLDDDHNKKGKRIHGVTVLGSIAKVHQLAAHSEMSIDRNSLWDEVSIGLGELCVNKKSAARYGAGVNGAENLKSLRRVQVLI